MTVDYIIVEQNEEGKIMKRFVSLLLVVLLMLMATVFAETKSFGLKLARGTGGYAEETALKETATGAAAKVTVLEKDNDIASMYYEIRKMDNVAASKYHNTSSIGTFSLAYLSTTVGRNGYNYKLRVAHRSQSKFDGEVTVSGTFTP